VVFALYGVLYAIPTGFRDSGHVVSLFVAGSVVDAIVAVLRPELPLRAGRWRAVGASVPFVAVSCLLIQLAIGPGLAWHISVWLGVLITSTMAGFGLACVMSLAPVVDR
jgi:uncharacterized membrane protein